MSKPHIPKSYAINPVGICRGTASNNNKPSAHWTLYNVESLSLRMSKSAEEIKPMLNETGFLKAIKIREEIINWKTQLKTEETTIHKEMEELKRKLIELDQRRSTIAYVLQNLRNVLRIPRDQLCEPSK